MYDRAECPERFMWIWFRMELAHIHDCIISQLLALTGHRWQTSGESKMLLTRYISWHHTECTSSLTDIHSKGITVLNWKSWYFVFLACEHGVIIVNYMLDLKLSTSQNMITYCEVMVTIWPILSVFVHLCSTLYTKTCLCYTALIREKLLTTSDNMVNQSAYNER